MKKITVLTVTALTLACLGGQSLAAQAASAKVQYQLSPKGNRVIFAYGSGCNVQDIFDKLENCIPNITLPDCNAPEVDAPEADAPETNLPEVEIPEIEHAFIREVVDLVNAERAKEGLSPLTLDTKVSAAAQVRAKECEQSFSHTRPNGSSFATALKEQNVSYRNAGENIAWGQRSPEAVMKAWMNSSGHRANIMNANFTTIGVGYYRNANGTNYWCQLFTR
ncbi:MAG: hypothetical protein J6A94_02730 [Lachnospiraceae bacterium]|nr:hypothetical protein [Lachnospiraceae bacterium]